MASAPTSASPPPGQGAAVIVGWEKWPDRLAWNKGNLRPLRQLELQLGGGDPVLRAQVVHASALVLYLPGAFDRLVRVTMGSSGASMESILRSGLRVGGQEWHFFGCSNSMLAEEKPRVYMMRGKTEEVAAFRRACFPNIEQKPRAKQLKYAGLLMSQCQAVVELPPGTSVQEAEDVEREDVEGNNHCFTDGCGAISPALAEHLRQSLSLDFCPSVWQVRYCGHGAVCKGVLLVNPALPGHALHFRGSMQKAGVAGELETLSSLIGVVNWSKPGALVKLNNQAVALLSVTVPPRVFEDIHQEHLAGIAHADACPNAALALLAGAGVRELLLWKDLAEKYGSVTHPHAYQDLLNLQASVLKGQRARVRLHMPLFASRLLYGACCPELGLREGTCFVQVTVNGKRTVVEGPVIVYRMPSYVPGDVRVLQAVVLPDNAATDCILFSAEGHRPSADMMSGGDLDGDQFAVIWDERMTCFAKDFVAEPLDYQPPARQSGGKVEGDLIGFVVGMSSGRSQLSRIDGLFWQYADAQGVDCPECRGLALLFSRAVDKLPGDDALLERLEMEAPPDRRQSLWARLEQRQQVKAMLCDSQASKKRWDRFRSAKCWPGLCEAVCPEALNVAPPWLVKTLGLPGKSAPRGRCRCLCSDDGAEHAASAVTGAVCAFDCVDPRCAGNHPQGREAMLSWCEHARAVLCEGEAQEKYAATDENVVSISARLAKAREVLASAEVEVESQARADTAALARAEAEAEHKARADRMALARARAVAESRARVEMAAEEAARNSHTFWQRMWDGLAGGNRVKSLEARISESMASAVERVEAERSDTLWRRLWRRCQEEFRSLEARISDRMAAAMGQFEAERSGALWRRCQERVEAAELQRREAAREVEAVRRELRLLKASRAARREDFGRVLWSSVPREILHTPFARWRASVVQTKQETQRREGLMQRHDAARARLKAVEERVAQLAAERDEHYSEDALEEAVRARDSAAASLRAVDAAACSLTARAQRLFVDLAGPCEGAERAERNSELRAALWRERRRLDSPLPVHASRAEILEAVRRHNAVVVTAGTGSGKSTQVPAFLVDDLVLGGPVICTQPRRVAARNLARRVAHEFDTELGNAVGFHYGSRGLEGESQRKSEATRLLFVTDGLLLHNEKLPIGALVIDEAHERGKDSDLLLARWRRRRLSGVPVEPLVVMSASINAQRFADYIDCPVVDIPGKLHDVEVHYVPAPAVDGKSSGEIDEDTSAMVQHACDTLFTHIVGNATHGDVLIFLPGRAEIEECIRLIQKRDAEGVQESEPRQQAMDWAERLWAEVGRPLEENGAASRRVQQELREVESKLEANRRRKGARKLNAQKRKLESEAARLSNERGELTGRQSRLAEKSSRKQRQCWRIKRAGTSSSSREMVDAYPLFGALSQEEQDQATNPEVRRDPACRKVICCTNVAETSLTIGGVRFVIDSGLARQIHFDHELRCSALQLMGTSQAAAKQRQGRAGRIASGWCFRLFSEEEFRRRDEFELPEMKKTPTEQLLLYLLRHDVPLDNLGLMDSPPEWAIRAAVQALEDLGFVDDGGRKLTEDGKVAAQLDLRPWSSRMLMESGPVGCQDRALLMVSLMEEMQDFRWGAEHAEFFSEGGDLLSWLRLWDAYKRVQAGDQKAWCSARGLCAATLSLVEKRVVRLRKVLGRHCTLASGEGTEEGLLRAFLRGYFCFFAEAHDACSPRAGYSMLRPGPDALGDADSPVSGGRDGVRPGSGGVRHDEQRPPDGRPGGPSLQFEVSRARSDERGPRDERPGGPLLQLEVSRFSALYLSGGHEPFRWVVFMGLRRIKAGAVLMSAACAVDPAVLLQEAPSAWKERMRLDTQLCTTGVGPQLALLRRSVIERVGPGLLRQVLKDRCKLVRDLESETSAKVHVAFETAAVLVAGTEAAVDEAARRLRSRIQALRSELLRRQVGLRPCQAGLKCFVGLGEDGGAMAVRRQIGDPREAQACGRQVVVLSAAQLTPQALAWCRQRAAVLEKGPSLELTFGRDEDCLEFLERGAHRFGAASPEWTVFRQMRTEVALAADSLECEGEPLLRTLAAKFPSVTLTRRREVLVIEQQRYDKLSSPFVRDQRSQVLQYLRRSGVLEPREIPAAGAWKELQAVRKEVGDEHRSSCVEFEPGRFLVFGDGAAADAAVASLQQKLGALKARASQELALGGGSGLAALQGPGGGTLAAIREASPEVDIAIDLNRRVVRAQGPSEAVKAAVALLSEALQAAPNHGTASCARCGSPIVQPLRLLLCGCRYCQSCFTQMCLAREPCVCGSPVLPTDVAECLSEQGRCIFKFVYSAHLEAQCTEQELVHVCAECTWPFLALRSCRVAKCRRCAVVQEVGPEEHVDVQFSHDSLGDAEWRHLRAACDVRELGQGWLRLSGNASAIEDALALCEDWTRRATEAVPTPPRMERFLIRELKAARFEKDFCVSFCVRARVVEISGSSARTASAQRWLRELVGRLKSDSVPLLDGQGGKVLHRFKARIQWLRDQDKVCVEIGEQEIVITGFSQNVARAKAALQNLVAQRSAHIELPSVSGCAGVSWRFVKPTLEHLKAQDETKGVVQWSSGPGHVDLKGFDECVCIAEEAIRAQLAAFTGRAIPVAREQKGLVIGTKGANIKRWQAGGLVVIMGDDRDDNAYIGGEEGAVASAERELAEILAKARSTPHTRVGPTDLERRRGRAGGGAAPGERRMPCRFYARGHCARGRDCIYRHEDVHVGGGGEGWEFPPAVPSESVEQVWR